MILKVGGIILTKHGRGVVRALSLTHDSVTSIDVALVDDAGKTIGWCVIGIHDILGGNE